MAGSNMKVSSPDFQPVHLNYCTSDHLQAPYSECSSPGCRDGKHNKNAKSGWKSDCISSKDASKRKRVNRTAKLKQCKLDARREQWLSQGSQSICKQESQDCSNKGKDVATAYIEESSAKPTSHSTCQMLKPNKGRYAQEDICLELINLNQEEWKAIQRPEFHIGSLRKMNSESDVTPGLSTHDRSTLIKYPTETVKGACGMCQGLSCSNVKVDAEIRKSGSRCSLCLIKAPSQDEESKIIVKEPKPSQGNMQIGRSTIDLSVYHSGNTAYARSGTEENEDTHDAEDDWETVADAIHVQGSASSVVGMPKTMSLEGELLEKNMKGLTHSDLKCNVLKPEYKHKGAIFGPRPRGTGGRAWRPDDTSRPPTLPRLYKQHSFPLQSGPTAWSGVHANNLWGPPAAPSYCPICTEELDLTDSCFFPCSCGFRLCLFCHHRIAADDGRCPGCRKTYNSDAAIKLSRPCNNVWVRV